MMLSLRVEFHCSLVSEDGGSRNGIEDHHRIEMLLGLQVLNNSSDMLIKFRLLYIDLGLLL